MRGRDREATLFRMELELLHRLAGAAAVSGGIRTLTHLCAFNLGETLLAFVDLVDSRGGTHLVALAKLTSKVVYRPIAPAGPGWPWLSPAIHNAHDCRS